MNEAVGPILSSHKHDSSSVFARKIAVIVNHGYTLTDRLGFALGH